MLFALLLGMAMNFLSEVDRCMAGISFVIGPTALVDASAGVGRSYSLNLERHERSLRTGQFLFTPPVQVVYALAQALAETLAEGVPARAARYRACYEVMLAGMRGLGFEPLLPDALEGQHNRCPELAALGQQTRQIVDAGQVGKLVEQEPDAPIG